MFRLSRYVFEAVLAEISPDLTDSNYRNSQQKISARLKLGVVLYYLTDGGDAVHLQAAVGPYSPCAVRSHSPRAVRPRSPRADTAMLPRSARAVRPRSPSTARPRAPCAARQRSSRAVRPRSPRAVTAVRPRSPRAARSCFRLSDGLAARARRLSDTHCAGAAD
jgi:hypothetical protein